MHQGGYSSGQGYSGQGQQEGQLESGSLVPNKLQWLPGHEYTFEYEGRLLSGLPQLSSQYAGLGIKCNVRVAVTRSQVEPQNQRFTVKVEQPE